MAEENKSASGASPQDPEAGASPPELASATHAAESAPAEIVSEDELGSRPAIHVSSASSPLPVEQVGNDALLSSVSSTARQGSLTPGQRLAAKKAAKAVEKRESKEERRRSEEEARQKEQEEADNLLGRARPEPALPAAEQKAASTFSDFLQDNRGRILGLVAAGVVIALVSFGVQRFARSGAAEQAAQLGSALELANAPVDPDDTDGKTDDDKPLFKTEQERATKSLAAFDDVVTAEGDSAAAAWAKLAGAAAQLELGKYDEARARFQGVYDAHTKEPQLAARGLEGVGIALEAAGKPDEALKAYEKLKYVEGEKDLSEYHVARIKLAKGDREGGKTMLKALYDHLSKPAEGAPPSRFLKSEVEVRLAEIDSTLVDKSGAGDQPQQFSEEQIQRLLEQLQKNGGGAAPGAPK